jgi:hypothetical protein
VEQGTPELDLFEIISLENTSHLAFIGSKGAVLTVPLPAGAAQIIPQPGFNFGQPHLDGNKLITTGAITPGSQDAMFAYVVPYTGSKTILNIGTNQPTGSLSVLIKKGSYKMSSPSMHDAGTVDLGGTTYQVLSLDNPVVGDIVAVTVTGLPKGGASTSDSNRGTLYAAIAAGVGLLVAAGLIFQLVRRRRHAALVAAGAGGAAITESHSPEDERLALAAELNQLDDDHAAGKVDDETYARARQEIMDELREISRGMHGLTGEAD